jgi:glycosyltransferase involved in cell wall biosynthesis
MKIAQIAPLIESVPPKLYGGTERVVSYLTEELVRQGHDVTLFASGDSCTSAELVACAPAALRLCANVHDPFPHNIVMLEKVRQRAPEFDVLHFHIDYLHFPFFRNGGPPILTTMHGRLDLPDLVPLFEQFPDPPLASISYDQRKPLWHARWIGNVYHGLPTHLFPFDPQSDRGYLAYLGRICPEKRPDRAIEIARRAGMPLRIAAKVDRADEVYFTRRIAPLLKRPGIDYIGEIGEREKAPFLGNALALLFPIDWPEPFGLVMIEAMAYGTPVIAWRRGSVPEIIEDGVTGFIVDDLEEAVAVVKKARGLDRRRIRSIFERRFSAERMATEYLSLYRSMIDRSPHWSAQDGTPALSEDRDASSPQPA